MVLRERNTMMNKPSMLDKSMCRKCGEICGNRFLLGEHYKKNPKHRLPPREYSAAARKKAEELAEKTKKQHKIYIPVKHKAPKQTKEGIPNSMLRFCPHYCGMDIEKMSQAMALLQRMKG